MAAHLADLLAVLLAPLREGGGAWLVRAAMAAVFLYSAQDKLRHPQAAMREVRAGGLPLPSSALAMTIAVQLAGGLALLSTWPWVISAGALLLGLFTLAATLLFHRFWRSRGARRRQQLTAFLEHLAITGGLLSLAAQQTGVL